MAKFNFKIIQDIDDIMLPDIEIENIKLINEEKHVRTQFLQGLDFNKDIVLIGSGPTLDRRINRITVKEIFGDKISDNFYIVPINDKWLYCDEFDFAIGNDEPFWWGSQYMPFGKLFLTLSYSFGLNGNDIPYNLYKKIANNLLCVYQNNNSCYRPRKYNNHVFENNIDDILTIDINADTGGAISLKVLEQIGFKNFKLIGFGGAGNTTLEKDFEYIEKFKFNLNKNCYFNDNYIQFKNRIDIAFYKTFAIFIPTYITNNTSLEILVKNIQLLNKTMVSYNGRLDIFIINNSVIQHDLLVNELCKNNLLENIQILNNNCINAELGIFKYFKNVKHSYKYYINIHDSCVIENIFPTLENNLYYLWKTGFFINSPSAGGTHHLNEIKEFMNKYNLINYNLYEKLNTLNDNEILNVSDYFCFGCMFITNREILENVYNKIKHILEYDIDRRERMCLETIIGFFLYEANKKQNICAIEEKNWGSHSITNGNEFKYDYFTKFSFCR